MDLFYDYRTNVESSPAWQEWLRGHLPPLLVLWGRPDSRRIRQTAKTSRIVVKPSPPEAAAA